MWTSIAVGDVDARRPARRCIPDYPGANVRGIVPALLGPGEWSNAARAGSPSPSPGPTRRAARARRPRMGAAAGARDLMPTLSSMAGGPITTVAPTTTATALSSIATGLTPGRARPARVPARRRRRGAQRPALARTAGDRRRRSPAARRAALRRVPRPRRAGGLAQPSCRQPAFTEAHLRGSRPVGWRAASAIAVEIGQAAGGGGALRLRLLRRHRQDRPRAGLRRLLRRRAALRRPPRRRRARRAARPAPRCWSPPTTDRSTSAIASSSPPPTLLAMVAQQSGEGRFRWWHAKPGAGRRPG